MAAAGSTAVATNFRRRLSPKFQWTIHDVSNTTSGLDSWQLGSQCGRSTTVASARGSRVLTSRAVMRQICERKDVMSLTEVRLNPPIDGMVTQEQH